MEKKSQGKYVLDNKGENFKLKVLKNTNHMYKHFCINIKEYLFFLRLKVGLNY